MKNKIFASVVTTLLLFTTVGNMKIIQADSLKEHPSVITKNQSSVKEKTIGKMNPIHAGDYTITGHVSKPNIIIAISVAIR